MHRHAPGMAAAPVRTFAPLAALAAAGLTLPAGALVIVSVTVPLAASAALSASGTFRRRQSAPFAASARAARMEGATLGRVLITGS